jgi:RNA polymerase sigma factor (sigma-70 family)
MLGSLSEAEDAVQEAWLRLNRIDPATVDNLGGWLTTVVSRVCLDMLRSRKSRREEAIGAQVTKPHMAQGEGADTEGEALLADSVGVALLVVLDTLTPAERLVFVLHDLFGLPFDEIGSIVGRSPAAAKQLASRARRRVRGSPEVKGSTRFSTKSESNKWITHTSVTVLCEGLRARGTPANGRRSIRQTGRVSRPSRSASSLRARRR